MDIMFICKNYKNKDILLLRNKYKIKQDKERISANTQIKLNVNGKNPKKQNLHGKKNVKKGRTFY